MGAFHWYDLVVLAGIALLIFGPKRLPELGSSVGKTIREFQKSMREVTEPTVTQTTALPPAEKPSATTIPSETTAVTDQ